MNLLILFVQLVASAFVVLCIGYLWESFRELVIDNFRYLAWYKKIAVILIVPPILFAIGWFIMFIWLGPEHCDLIM